MDWTENTIALGISWYVVFIISTTLHEASHAFAALRLGDPTAYLGGQVTLDPRPHIQREPVGMVLVPIASFLLAGWMLGWASAPYDPFWAHRYPRRAALMALAGPAANLLLLVLSGVLIRLGTFAGVFEPLPAVGFGELAGGASILAESAATVLGIAFTLNLILLIFNLLPLPPLDGSAALALVLPQRMLYRYQALVHHPIAPLVGLVLAWQLFDRFGLFGIFFGLALKALFPELHYE